MVLLYIFLRKFIHLTVGAYIWFSRQYKTAYSRFLKNNYWLVDVIVIFFITKSNISIKDFPQIVNGSFVNLFFIRDWVMYKIKMLIHSESEEVKSLKSRQPHLVWPLVSHMTEDRIAGGRVFKKEKSHKETRTFMRIRIP